MKKIYKVVAIENNEIVNVLFTVYYDEACSVCDVWAQNGKAVQLLVLTI